MLEKIAIVWNEIIYFRWDLCNARTSAQCWLVRLTTIIYHCPFLQGQSSDDHDGDMLGCLRCCCYCSEYLISRLECWAEHVMIMTTMVEMMCKVSLTRVTLDMVFPPTDVSITSIGQPLSAGTQYEVRASSLSILNSFIINIIFIIRHHYPPLPETRYKIAKNIHHDKNIARIANAVQVTIWL